MVSEIHTLYETNCRSIPDMLRQSATSIENEVTEGCSATVAMFAIQMTAGGSIAIYGWGDCDNMTALAMVERGKSVLMSTFDRDDQA